MGRSHALAYHRLDGFEIVGLVSRSIRSTVHQLPAELRGYPLFEDYEDALGATRPADSDDVGRAFQDDVGHLFRPKSAGRSD